MSTTGRTEIAVVPVGTDRICYDVVFVPDDAPPPRRDLSRLWDAVALWVAIQGCREAGWPWPSWIHDLIPADE